MIPFTPMRRIVGQRMAQSKQTAPHFYISMDIDMTAVSKLRNGWKERGDESMPSINDFILQASARALKEFPQVNSSFTEQGILQHADINVGVAVALDEGLVVPVIRNADQLNLLELAKQSRSLADKAQNKKLFPLDYEGGTFTVSNLGMLGVDNFIAIINPPQCAILAVGRVAPRVVRRRRHRDKIHDDGDTVGRPSSGRWRQRGALSAASKKTFGKRPILVYTAQAS